jgi:hypothetical protein
LAAKDLSDRKPDIILNDLLPQHRPRARLPERCRVDDKVAKRTAIAAIAARDRRSEKSDSRSGWNNPIFRGKRFRLSAQLRWRNAEFEHGVATVLAGCRIPSTK